MTVSRPTPSSTHARRRMQANRRRDTGPELAIRRLLHARGLRYRVDAPLPFLPRRRVDIAFPGAKVAVQVHGCFWHACPEHGTRSRANAEYWSAKLDANQARDADTALRLAAAGWLLLVVWEHEPPEEAADRVRLAVSSRYDRVRSGRPGQNSGNS